MVMGMFQRSLKKNLKHLWGVFYVMTESVEKNAQPGRFNTAWACFLLYVDTAQVVRVLCQTRYGWNIRVFDLIKMLDIFQLAQEAGGTMFVKVLPGGRLPSYVFFSFSTMLVLVAIFDIFYVMAIFASGHVEKMWPVKMLIILVEALVTTGFSTIFGWMLIPIKCLVGSRYVSISEHIRGPGAECTPWALPEVLVSVPAIVLIIGYLWFATTSSLLSFSLNPLSRSARATGTGRVDFWYSIAQSAAAFLIYFTPAKKMKSLAHGSGSDKDRHRKMSSDVLNILPLPRQYTSPIATNFVLSAAFFGVFHLHVNYLPFNNHVMNCVRGGFLLTLGWIPGASAVLLSYIYASGQSYETIVSSSPEQVAMWVVLSSVIFTFPVGVCIVHWRRKNLYEIMVTLYGEYQAEQRAMLFEASSTYNDGSLVMSMDHSIRLIIAIPLLQCDGNDWGKSQRSIGSTSFHEPSAHKMVKKSHFDTFFDKGAEDSVVFSSWVECSATARTFLQRRNDMDLKFLNFIIKKGMQEHPMSDGLVILHIQMLRFVFRNPLQAAAQEKIFRVGGRVPNFDSQYTLYALERKLFQERACSDLGQDAVRAIDLMEFNLGMQTARAAQLAAVTSMKMFWRHLSKRNHKGHIADELMTRLETYDAAAAKAKEEYSWMLEKYSNSAQLMREWATFNDTVLNDEKMATDARVQAVSLEDQMEELQGHNKSERTDKEDYREEASERGGRAPSHGGGSSLSEATETKRTTVQRFFAKITQTILGREEMALDQFHQRIGLFVLTLLVVETVAFVFAVVFVFSDVATLDIHMIAFISLFRSHVATCGFYQRSSMLAAWRGDQDLLAKRSQAIVDLARQVEVEHWNLYQAAEGGMKTHLDSIKFAVQVPTGNKWMQDEFVYFDLIFDYVRRIRLSAKTTMQDFRDTQMAIGKISQAKSEVVYVQENLFRSVSEVFESLLKLYDNQLEAFISLATTLVIIISALAAAIVLIFGYFLLSGLLNTVQTVQYKLVVISMGLTLPRATAKKMYKHFHQIEFQLKSMEDEELERRDPTQMHEMHLMNGEQDDGWVGPDENDWQNEKNVGWAEEQDQVGAEEQGAGVGAAGDWNVQLVQPQDSPHLRPDFMMLEHQKGTQPSANNENFAREWATQMQRLESAETAKSQVLILNEENLQQHIKDFGGGAGLRKNEYFEHPVANPGFAQFPEHPMLHGPPGYPWGSSAPVPTQLAYPTRGSVPPNSGMHSHLAAWGQGLPSYAHPMGLGGIGSAPPSWGGGFMPPPPPPAQQYSPDWPLGGGGRGGPLAPQVSADLTFGSTRHNETPDSPNRGSHDERTASKSVEIEDAAPSLAEEGAATLKSALRPRSKQRSRSEEGRSFRRGRKSAAAEIAELRSIVADAEPRSGDYNGSTGGIGKQPTTGRKSPQRRRFAGRESPDMDGHHVHFHHRRTLPSRQSPAPISARFNRGDRSSHDSGSPTQAQRQSAYLDQGTSPIPDFRSPVGSFARHGLSSPVPGMICPQTRDRRPQIPKAPHFNSKFTPSHQTPAAYQRNPLRPAQGWGWAAQHSSATASMQHSVGGFDPGSGGGVHGTPTPPLGAGLWEGGGSHFPWGGEQKGQIEDAGRIPDTSGGSASSSLQNRWTGLEEDDAVASSGSVNVSSTENVSPGKSPQSIPQTLSCPMTPMTSKPSPLAPPSMSGQRRQFLPPPSSEMDPGGRSKHMGNFGKIHNSEDMLEDVERGNEDAVGNDEAGQGQEENRGTESQPKENSDVSLAKEVHCHAAPLDSSKSKKDKKKKKKKLKDGSGQPKPEEPRNEAPAAKDVILGLRQPAPKKLTSILRLENDKDAKPPRGGGGGVEWDRNIVSPRVPPHRIASPQPRPPGKGDDLQSQDESSQDESPWKALRADEMIATGWNASERVEVAAVKEEAVRSKIEQGQEGTGQAENRLVEEGKAKLDTDNKIQELEADVRVLNIDDQQPCTRTSAHNGVKNDNIRIPAEVIAEESARPESTRPPLTMEKPADNIPAIGTQNGPVENSDWRKGTSCDNTEDLHFSRMLEVQADMQRQGSLQAMISGKVQSVDEIEHGAKKKTTFVSRIYNAMNLGHQEGVRSLQRVVASLLPGDTATEDVKGALVQSLIERRMWHQNFNVYSVAIVILLALSTFCAVFPVEKVASFVNSASILNHASRRRYLIKNIVHLTREMVLDDGFSRFEKKQATAAISYYQEQFTRSDLAVRKGGVFGIRTGADDNNERHNQIMYTSGCPWRDDPSDCLIPSLPGKGQSGGLYQILSAFMDSVRKAIINYGSPPEEWPDDWKGQSGVTDKFQNVTLDFNKLAYFDSDLKLQFVMDSFEGDVAQGLGLISDILEDGAFASLQSGVRDNNTLYAVHVTCVIIIFYFGLVRYTMQMAHDEVKKARKFVLKMPFFILPPAEVEVVVDFFRREQNNTYQPRRGHQEEGIEIMSYHEEPKDMTKDEDELEILKATLAKEDERERQSSERPDTAMSKEGQYLKSDPVQQPEGSAEEEQAVTAEAVGKLGTRGTKLVGDSLLTDTELQNSRNKPQSEEDTLSKGKERMKAVVARTMKARQTLDALKSESLNASGSFVQRGIKGSAHQTLDGLKSESLNASGSFAQRGIKGSAPESMIGKGPQRARAGSIESVTSLRAASARKVSPIGSQSIEMGNKETQEGSSPKPAGIPRAISMRSSPSSSNWASIKKGVQEGTLKSGSSNSLNTPFKAPAAAKDGSGPTPIPLLKAPSTKSRDGLAPKSGPKQIEPMSVEKVIDDGDGNYDSHDSDTFGAFIKQAQEQEARKGSSAKISFQAAAKKAVPMAKSGKGSPVNAKPGKGSPFAAVVRAATDAAKKEGGSQPGR